MSALKNMPISFPGLFGDWELNIDPVAIHIGHGIYWYGIILAFAMLAGLYLCMKQAKHYGLTEDNIMDMVLWAVPCCIIGARFYYVLFYLDLYRNTDGSLDWGAMFRIWDGGLAIYGAVIAGVLVALVYTKRHKLPFFAMGDVAVMGLLLGQIIGRWANAAHQGATAGANMAGGKAEFDGNFLHNITHFMDMDFIGFGDNRLTGQVVTSGHIESGLYVEAVIGEQGLGGVNILDNYRISGTVKNYLYRIMESGDAKLSPIQRGILIKEGLKPSFIEKMEGRYHG